ncbi:hypothetical protein ACO2Q3_22355 [Caulobacter sp. KR2-114]|uniref:hypothetical protein n=1 Tax=Caulobacter sp. KR2-114 TaxID=3400912 RepID=UPI003C040613
MNDLLKLALDAHGGLDRWQGFNQLSVQASIAGAIWDVKQQPGLLTDKAVVLNLRTQCLAIAPFGGEGRRSVLIDGKLSIRDTDGGMVEGREDPEASFAGQQRETPWDRLHVAYFASEALWTYLNSPFLYAGPGFETEEIAPWQEAGETWRRLKVTFPKAILSHTRTQITYFGPDGLMRRHDYTVDILGGATGANYPSDYVEVQGLMMPARRRIHAYDEAGRMVPDPLLVSLDFSEFRFA